MSSVCVMRREKATENLRNRETVRLWVEAADPFVHDQSWNQSQFQKANQINLKGLCGWFIDFVLGLCCDCDRSPAGFVASSIRVCLQVVLDEKHFHTWELRLLLGQTDPVTMWKKSRAFISFKFGHNRLQKIYIIYAWLLSLEIIFHFAPGKKFELRKT